MKTKWIIVVVATVALAGGAIYFSNIKLQKGTIGGWATRPINDTSLVDPGWTGNPGRSPAILERSQEVAYFVFNNPYNSPVSVLRLRILCDGTMAEEIGGNNMSVAPAGQYEPTTLAHGTHGSRLDRSPSCFEDNRVSDFSQPVEIQPHHDWGFTVNYDTMYHTYNTDGSIVDHPGHWSINRSTFNVGATATWHYIGDATMHTTSVAYGPTLRYGK